MKRINLSGFIIMIIGIILFYFILTIRWRGDNDTSWRHVVEGDGRGYYAYLPAILIYHDLNFDFIKRAETPVAGNQSSDYLYLMSGQRGNKYFIGTALLISPFFLLAWLISYLLGYSLTGYNQIFYGAVSVASLFYMLAGLFFLRKILRLYGIKELWISVILLLTVFGTNVFHYVVYEPSMSHIYSFFVVSTFIYFLKRYQSDKKLHQIILTTISLALIAIIRPVNAVIIFSAPFLLGSYGELKLFVKEFITNRKHILLSLFAFSLVLFIQPLLLFFTYGSFFVYPYKGEGFYFFDGHFWDTLISYKKGLFIYTPLMFFAVISVFGLIRKSVYSVAAFIIFFLILNFIISGWGSWSFGGSFGLRAFIEFYPLLIIPLSLFINNIKRPVPVILVSMLFSAILAVSLIQTWQYEHLIIHYADMDKDKFWNVFLHTNKRYKIYSYPQHIFWLDEKDIKTRKIILNDFENVVDNENPKAIVSDQWYSPNHSLKSSNERPYSPCGYSSDCRTFLDEGISYVRVKLMAKILDWDSEAKLVISLESADGRIFHWEAYELSFQVDELNKWKPLYFDLPFPELKPDDVLKVYVWNTFPSPTYVDDMKIEFYVLK